MTGVALLHARSRSNSFFIDFLIDIYDVADEDIEYQRKCLLLTAILALAPLVADTRAMRSPAPAILHYLIAEAAISPEVSYLSTYDSL